MTRPPVPFVSAAAALVRYCPSFCIAFVRPRGTGAWESSQNVGCCMGSLKSENSKKRGFIVKLCHSPCARASQMWPSLPHLTVFSPSSCPSVLASFLCFVLFGRINSRSWQTASFSNTSSWMCWFSSSVVVYSHNRFVNRRRSSVDIEILGVRRL